VPHRGKRNEPAYVKLVAEAMARIKAVSLEEIAQITTGNVLKLFKI
jgi:TatD DNase family protein